MERIYSTDGRVFEFYSNEEIADQMSKENWFKWVDSILVAKEVTTNQTTPKFPVQKGDKITTRGGYSYYVQDVIGDAIQVNEFVDGDPFKVVIYPEYVEEVVTPRGDVSFRRARSSDYYARGGSK